MPSPSAPLHLHPLSRFAAVLGVFVTKEQRGIVGKAAAGWGAGGGEGRPGGDELQRLLRPRNYTRNLWAAPFFRSFIFPFVFGRREPRSDGGKPKVPRRNPFSDVVPAPSLWGGGLCRRRRLELGTRPD